MFRKLIDKINRRPWPLSFKEFKNLRVSYSQFGEDLILSTLFGQEKKNGFYIDIGCYHPLTYSNSYIFYRRGWSGICIDPNPMFKILWMKYRPRDHFINTAIANNQGEAYYELNAQYPACNRLIFEKEQRSNCNYIKVPTISLEIQLTQLEVYPETNIDFISIDCEGCDLEVIKTLNLKNYEPQVILIEDSELSDESNISNYMRENNYELNSCCFHSKIFVRSTFL